MKRIVSFLFLCYVFCEVSYKNYSVVELFLEDDFHVSLLHDLIVENRAMMWSNSPPKKGNNYVLIPPNSELGLLEEKLTKVLHKDIQKIIDSSKAKNDDPDFFSDYHTLDEINAFITSLAAKYPQLAQTFTLGTTYEGRTQLAIAIGSNLSSPVIFFEGGVHAREWISPATVTYFAYYLLNDYSSQGSDSTKELVDNLLWVILPVTNPDGYVYTHTVDRMWRKNRFPTGVVQNGTQCIGVDLNRNWNYSFSSDDPNPNPCGESYPGKSGFDQPETLALTSAINKFVDSNGIYLYIDWHSCGQLWMYPWAFSKNQAPFWNLQERLGQVALDSLTPVFGTNYTLGPIAEIIYQVGGSSVDWTFDVMSIIYSYGVELRDTGNYCFVLPPDQIRPTGEETYAAIKAMGHYLLLNPPFTGQ